MALVTLVRVILPALGTTSSRLQNRPAPPLAFIG